MPDQEHQNFHFRHKDELQNGDRSEVMSRRHFVHILFSAIFTGCATGGGMKPNEIEEGLASFSHEIEDPHGWKKYLRQDEYLIPDVIFDAYSETIDKRPRWSTPVGGYSSMNYLDTEEELTELREKLQKLGFKKEVIEFYESLFQTSDIIIFRESILQDKFFLKALPHERFHKALDHLSREEYALLERVAKELIHRDDGKAEAFLQEKIYDGKNDIGFMAAATRMNWKEFYPYLAQDEFEDHVENALKNEHPQAFKIFHRIKETCKLKE